MAFDAQPPDLRRSPLTAKASLFHASSPWIAAPSIRFLFVGSHLRYALPSARPSRDTPCASLRSLRSGHERTFTSKSSVMPGTRKTGPGPKERGPSRILENLSLSELGQRGLDPELLGVGEAQAEGHGRVGGEAVDEDREVETVQSRGQGSRQGEAAQHGVE